MAKEKYDGMLFEDGNMGCDLGGLNYHSVRFTVSQAGQLANRKFNLPRGYKSLVGYYISSSFGMQPPRSLESTIEILCDGREIVAEGTPMQLFFCNSYKSFNERFFDKVNEEIDQPLIEINYLDGNASLSFPYEVEIMFVLKREHEPNEDKYIIQPCTLDITKAGLTTKLFETFSKYDRIVGYTVCGLDHEIADSDGIGVKVANKYLIESNMPLSFMKPEEFYTTFVNRFFPANEEVNSSPVEVIFKDNGTYATFGGYKIHVCLLLKGGK